MPRIREIADAPRSCADFVIFRMRPIVKASGVSVVLRHVVEVVEELLRAHSCLITGTRLRRLVPDVVRCFYSIARRVVLEHVWVLAVQLWRLLFGVEELHAVSSLSKVLRGLIVVLLEHRYLLIEVLMQLCIILDVIVHRWANIGFGERRLAGEA